MNIRYYQIARCYRDEKSKPERQPEFTQLDVELSFTSRENVMKLIEELMRYALQIGSNEPQFPVMTYNDAMVKFGTDQPDTGGFVWIVDFPLFNQKEEGKLESSHHPFTMPLVEETVYEDPLKVGKS